jgi:hypothetical protein
LNWLQMKTNAEFAYAQKAPRIQSFQELVKAPKEGVHAIADEKILGVTLWSDDFANPATWTLDNSGQSGVEFGWNINSTNDGWWANSGIASTSGGNYAELVNGDAQAATQALNVVYTLTTAQPIDIAALGGSNQVSLQFQQYGARFNDLQEIQISTDGTTWVTVGDNLDKTVLSAAGGSAYANPDTKIINLATFLAAFLEAFFAPFLAAGFAFAPCAEPTSRTRTDSGARWIVALPSRPTRAERAPPEG